MSWYSTGTTHLQAGDKLFIYFVQDEMTTVAYKKVYTSCEVLYICIQTSKVFFYRGDIAVWEFAFFMKYSI